MIKFPAAAFYKHTTAMTHMRAMIRDKSSVEIQPDGSTTITMIGDAVLLHDMQERCDEMHEACEQLGARLTAMTIAELRSEVRPGLMFGPTWEGLRDHLDQIDRRLQDELTLATLLALEPKEKDWYEPAAPLFGKDFGIKFPSALFDLDEAAKCLGLGRATAAAFHLMRLTEIGLKAISTSLYAVLPSGGAARNWGEVLKAIKAAIDAKTSGKTWSAGDREFFERCHASLDAIRVAWRNPTMHVENKYTADEAEHIFLCVKGFMKSLTSRMDENGEPKA